MFFVNGEIHTMFGKMIPNGFLQVTEGKITAIGDMADLKIEDCEESRFDLHGAFVCPGFIDAHTHLGMWEDGLGFEGDDGNEETDPATPQLRATDAVNPMDRCFQEALEAGITTVVTGPGSANPVGGTLIAMKTSGNRVDDMLLQDPLAVKMALGENPKSVYHGKGQAPVTRMATAAIIREQLMKARRYMEDVERAQEDPDFDLPELDLKCEALLPLLRREIPVHIHCHRADDMFTALRLAKEFNLKLVLVHGTEGAMIADSLAKEKVPVLSGPILCDRSKPELRNLTPKTPGVLARAGIKTCLVTDHPVIPIQYLPVCAGLAVREGMDWNAALEAITCVPAEICGLTNRVGTLATGTDADFLVFDRDPLTLSAKPKMVFVDGVCVLNRESEKEG